VRHGQVGEVHVDDDAGRVTWRGEPLVMDPVASVPISRLHYW
jgi:hypothetical protein